MDGESFYNPLNTREITSTIDFEKVGNDFPFARQLKNKQGVWRDAFALAVVPETYGAHFTPRLERTTWKSARSHVVAESRNAFWGSKDDGFYNCVDIKGNRLDDPKVQPDTSNHQWGLRIYGLQDIRYARYAQKVGEILRAIGVEMERIERIITPEEYYFDNYLKPTSIDEFKEYLIERAKNDSRITAITGGEEKTARYIEQFEPGIVVRSLQVPERIADLEIIKTEEELKTVMTRVFKFVNTKLAILGDPRRFDSSKVESIREYFLTYLPENFGRNLAKIHNLGLRHGYLHTQNISLAGSIYDLDSVEGEIVNGVKQDAKALRMEFLDIGSRGSNRELWKFYKRLKGSSFYSDEMTDLQFVDSFTEKFQQAYDEERKYSDQKAL